MSAVSSSENFLSGGFVLEISPCELSVMDGKEGLLQSGFWGVFKSEWGWRPLALRWTLQIDAGSFSGRLLVLERAFPGGFTMAYVPYGPVLPDSFPAASSGALSVFLGELSERIKGYLSGRCFVIRFDLKDFKLQKGGASELPGSNDISNAAQQNFTAAPGADAPDDNAPGGAAAQRKFATALHKPLIKAPYRVQPQHSVVLDLTPDTDVILAQMHKKWRYNIRLSQRKGVTVSKYSGSEALKYLEKWYELYKVTSERDGIALHSFNYYKSLFETAVSYASISGALKVPDISLYLAEHEGDLLAGIITAFYSGSAVYLYGASGNEKRSLMPNYLLQWQAITDAKEAGAAEYDFFGIPAAPDPKDPMYGLWRFKTGFGGEIRHYAGAWDYPLIKPVYKLYRLAEKIRGNIASIRKKRR